MKTFVDCIPCLVHQVVDSTHAMVDDSNAREAIVRTVLHDLATMDFERPPAAMAQIIHRHIRDMTGVADPYAERKRRLNDAAMRLYPICLERINNAVHPLELAARFAIAGNIMDLGVKNRLTEDEMLASFDESVDGPLDGRIDEFARAVEQANTILYLADNAGEIVFDRLLVERLPREKVTVAVRGKPVINDATLDDARYVGLAEVVNVVDNGSDAPGTILEDCGNHFCRLFEEADMIISKGQGNYETLTESSRPIYFLLRVKCPIIARDLECPVGTAVLRRSPRDSILASMN